MEAVRSGILFLPRLLRRLYDWVLSLADHPRASTWLFALAFAESSFFPIPPDVLLIALGLAHPRRVFHWATICLAGSVIGGAFGYYIGVQFMDAIGFKILSLYHLEDKYLLVQDLYRQYDAWAVATGGFTPLPYKLFTITAGAFKIDFPTFMMASLISRGGRFFLVGGLIYLFGPRVKRFIDEYFNICTLIFTILLIGGYILIKWVVT